MAASTTPEASTRERLDLAAGLLGQAVKLVAIRQAQPVQALAAVHLATEILERLAAEIEEVRR